MAAYNKNHAGVKRLMREAIEMREATDLYFAQPIDDESLFEWHFTVRGPPDTEFEEGIYHGRISFPPEYPMKPPSIFMLTKNGRFEINKKICLSISGYHPETWLPSWSVRTALLAIIGFMPSKSEGAVGSLDYTPEERRKLAKMSLYFKCLKCGVHCGNILRPREVNSTASNDALEMAKSLAKNQFKPQTSSGEEQQTNHVSDSPNAVQSVPYNDGFDHQNVVDSDSVAGETKKLSECRPETNKARAGKHSMSSISRERKRSPVASADNQSRVLRTPASSRRAEQSASTSTRVSREQSKDVTLLGLIVAALVVMLAIISLLLRRVFKFIQ